MSQSLWQIGNQCGMHFFKAFFFQYYYYYCQQKCQMWSLSQSRLLLSSVKYHGAWSLVELDTRLQNTRVQKVCCPMCFIASVIALMYILKNKVVLEPRVSPVFAITYFCNHCNIRFENTSKYVDTLTLFSKKLNQRSLTPRWPLTPCLLRSHVWLYPRIIVSKSHDNTSMYVDTVINFAKYHIHIIRTYYVQNEWSHSLLLNSVEARQKRGN